MVSQFIERQLDGSSLMEGIRYVSDLRNIAWCSCSFNLLSHGRGYVQYEDLVRIVAN